jgi:autotransporter-associated beta strand protein
VLKSSDVSASEIEFYDSSSAGSASILNEGGEHPIGSGAGVLFFDNSAAANATIAANGGMVADALGAFITFDSSSTADHALLIANGTAANGAFGGRINFYGLANAGAATIIANGSRAAGSRQDMTAVDGRAGTIVFLASSSGGTARLELLGNAVFDISDHTPLGMQIGSIEGQGLVLLQSNNLIVGTNNRSTTFSGRILQTGHPRIGGSINKVGTGDWVLSGANTYRAGTTIAEGFLRVSNTTGSATGTGPVQIDGGTLGGGGIISGPVTVGSGTGSGAFLAPGGGATILTLQSSLTFKADGTYAWRFRTASAKADKVIANGVTIEPSAQFDAISIGHAQLVVGTSFTAISNTSATPITGTFANLADGSIVTVGSNKFQANYEGGDGNDLTLTVVP